MLSLKKEGRNMAKEKINYIDFPYVLPSIHLIKCPKCTGSNIEIIGVKGVAGKAMGNLAGVTAAGILGGAIGGAIYGAVKVAADAKAPPPQVAAIRFQCSGCKEKFETEPHGTNETDILEAPYTITFTRKGVFGDDQYYMFLNGFPVSVVPTFTNTFVFPTNVKRNTLILINPIGKPVKNGVYEFQATPGGSLNLLYTKKQLSVV
jgi:hypothetical protein